MATQAQIDANRRNAQKSTGPRSLAGKAVSRMNALKSGVHAESEIIRGENPAGLEALTSEYIERFHPATPEQRFYVDILIRDDWKLRRLSKAEAEMWNRTMEGVFLLEEANQTFARLQRRINDLERSYKAALRELERLQEQLPDGPGPQPLEPVDSSTQIGFVPPNGIEPCPRPSSALDKLVHRTLAPGFAVLALSSNPGGEPPLLR